MNKKILAIAGAAFLVLIVAALFVYTSGFRFWGRSGRGFAGPPGGFGSGDVNFSRLKEALQLPEDATDEQVLEALGLPEDASQEEIRNALEQKGITPRRRE